MTGTLDQPGSHKDLSHYCVQTTARAAARPFDGHHNHHHHHHDFSPFCCAVSNSGRKGGALAVETHPCFRPARGTRRAKCSTVATGRTGIRPAAHRVKEPEGAHEPGSHGVDLSLEMTPRIATMITHSRRVPQPPQTIPTPRRPQPSAGQAAATLRCRCWRWRGRT